MPSKRRVNRSAFSLLELSISILIVGIIISGIFASRILIKKFRISAAQSLTISSPVNAIKDSSLWLESSLDKSFNETESSDNNPITTWYDIREIGTKVNATQSNTSNTPKYSNTINSIQAVKFDDTTSSYLEIPDASFLNNTDYTIFILEQRASNKTDNYFIGDNANANEATNNQNLTLGYSADGVIKHSQGGASSYNAAISSYAESGNKPRIFTFIQNSSSGKKTYINGLLAAESGNVSKLNNITSLRIGNDYNGQIGEIVMFSRALTKEERQSTEEYLAKKWASPLLNVNSSNANCTSGTVTTTGCQASCAVAINGIATTSVTEGSGSLNCSQTGYDNTTTISYTCANSTLTPTSSPTTCPCASGYSLNGSTCELTPQPCTVAINGVATTSVNEGNGSLNCSQTGYDNTVNISYTCANSTLTPTSSPTTCPCASGYSLNGSACELTPQPCTGGTINTTSVPGSTIHTFTSSGTLNCPVAKTVQVLVVAGGGGSAFISGGGGGGGVVYNSSYSLLGQSYSVTVGAGGAANNSSGANSVFDAIIAYGGGGGGSNGTKGLSGGSGGGSGRDANHSVGGAATTGIGGTAYGNPGGGSMTAGWDGGGGGGGAGAAGGRGFGNGNSSAERGGNGGIGITNSITGSSLYYGGGGGGSVAGSNVPSTGGLGGGGGGGQTGSSGTPNTGGGGGGGHNGPSGAGGSGIVIVRYTN